MGTRHPADKFVKGEQKNIFDKMSFYRFNQFTGRIAASLQNAAYNPAGLQSKVIESAPAQFGSKSIAAVVVPEPMVTLDGAPATFENSRGMYPVDPEYRKKIIDTQTEWAKTPHLYVWQKRGTIDAVPYYTTYALCAIGMAYVMKIMYDMSFPKPPQ